MRKALLIACLLACTTAFAQDSLDLAKLIYTTNHISIDLIPQLVQKAGITRNKGDYQLGSSHMHGVEIGATYHINFNKYYSLVVGLHGGASARNYLLHIPKEDFDPPAPHDYDDNGAWSRSYDFYLSAPVLLETRWWYHKRKFWNANAGINIRFYPDEIYEITNGASYDGNGDRVQVFTLDLLISSNFKPWLTYAAGGGHSWILGNYNMLSLSFLANFSATKLVDGTYRITVPGQPVTEGTYSAKLSYIGLSINYTLTGANRTLRKLYERRLYR